MIDWKACAVPDLQPCEGRLAALAPFDPKADGDALFAALGGPRNDDLWRYIPFGPFESAEILARVFAFTAESDGWQTLVIRGAESGDALGTASYMRLRPEMGSAEVGAVLFSKALQRTPIATEAMYMMARYLFDELGYRRYEWKCDNGNAASKNAALRFGFTFEGVFRQDLVVKGRNRDTAWFSMLDGEWPRIRAAFEAWLAPGNFDHAGQQQRSLVELRNAL